MMRLEFVLLGEDSGSYMGRGPPWGVSELSHILGATVTGPALKHEPPWLLEGQWA